MCHTHTTALSGARLLWLGEKITKKKFTFEIFRLIDDSGAAQKSAVCQWCGRKYESEAASAHGWVTAAPYASAHATRCLLRGLKDLFWFFFFSIHMLSAERRIQTAQANYLIASVFSVAITQQRQSHLRRSPRRHLAVWKHIALGSRAGSNRRCGMERANWSQFKVHFDGSRELAFEGVRVITEISKTLVNRRNIRWINIRPWNPININIRRSTSSLWGATARCLRVDWLEVSSSSSRENRW